MTHTLAIDFGTTNSVIARWDDSTNAPRVLHLPTIGTPEGAHHPSMVPSLLYVRDGKVGAVTVGEQVRTASFDSQKNNRLFRNFKRGIVATPAPEPREIDGEIWDDSDAGRAFLRQLIAALPDRANIEQLVLTAPVASFEGYINWLNSIFDENGLDRVRIVDESTAAALGYRVTEPGAVVLVFDFGGGTLDLSLVQLPETREKTGGFLRRLRSGSANQHTAKVIAKAGRIIGGSDIDQWVVMEILKRAGVTPKVLGASYAGLLTACEQAKIALSDHDSAPIHFEADGKTHTIILTRAEMEAVLEANGFYQAIRHVVDKVMYVARQRGIYKEDIHYVLLVGGTSLMPSVQTTLKGYFTDLAVRSDKPFTAVAEGALQVAAGFGVEDYLAHSYGLRHLDAETGEHGYDEIIPVGTRYPTDSPVEMLLGAAHDGQTELEFVVGEIDTDSVAMIEVKYEDGQAVFVAQGSASTQQIIPLNEASARSTIARLIPPGLPGVDRVKASFSIDDRRQLRLTVTDLHSQATLVDNVVVASLR